MLNTHNTLQTPIVLMLLTVFLSINSSAKTKVFGIGDSNARYWGPELEKALGSEYHLIVDGRGGRTIAFDNGDRKSKNTEVIIHSLLSSGQKSFGGAPDIVLINLGTNDTKAIFDNQQDEVIADMVSLAGKIVDFEFTGGKFPKIVFSSPIAANPEITSGKYANCYLKLKALMPHFRSMCLHHRFGFIDLFNPTLEKIKEYTASDGIHLTGSGAKAFGQLVADGLNDKIPPQSPSQVKKDANTYSWQGPEGDILGYELYAKDSLIAVTDSIAITITEGLAPQSVIARDYIGNKSPHTYFSASSIGFPGLAKSTINNGFSKELFSLSGRRQSAWGTGYYLQPGQSTSIMTFITRSPDCSMCR